MDVKLQTNNFPLSSSQEIVKQYYEYYQALKKLQNKNSHNNHMPEQIFDSASGSSYQLDSFDQEIDKLIKEEHQEIYEEGLKLQEKDQEGDPEQQTVKKKLGNSRRKAGKRKIRTTITRQKLQKMNRLFHQYSLMKQKGMNPHISLREIGWNLQLGYSTILHKFRQFRQNSKVKESVLLQSKTKKRKYKKSLHIEREIYEALCQKPFFTAIQLSKYIYKTRNVMLSRSIISRHLAQMGYSFNNMKNLFMYKNSVKYISVRKKFADVLDYTVKPGSTLIFVDQFAFPVSTFKKQLTTGNKTPFQKKGERTQSEYVSLMIAADVNKIHYYEIKHGFFNKDQFKDLIRYLGVQFNQYQQSADQLYKPVILTDTNYIHYDSTQDVKACDLISQVIEKCGFKRYFLPPGSPQLNPILSMFIKIKQRIGKQDGYDPELLAASIERQIISLCNQSVASYFQQLPVWMDKARNGQQF